MSWKEACSQACHFSWGPLERPAVAIFVTDYKSDMVSFGVIEYPSSLGSYHPPVFSYLVQSRSIRILRFCLYHCVMDLLN